MKIFKKKMEKNTPRYSSIAQGTSIPNFNLGLKWFPGPKNEHFQKIKNTTPGIYSRNKCAKFQPKSKHFWALQTAPKFLGHTDDTHRQTDRHCQIIAQLKLRMFFIIAQELYK